MKNAPTTHGELEVFSIIIICLQVQSLRKGSVNETIYAHQTIVHLDISLEFCSCSSEVLI